MNIKECAEACHRNAVDKGFWQNRDKNNIESTLAQIALVHSELGEATEAIRTADKINFAEELADVIIRVFDMSIGLGIDIEEEVIKKMMKNKSRPYMHNKLA